MTRPARRVATLAMKTALVTALRTALVTASRTTLVTASRTALFTALLAVMFTTMLFPSAGRAQPTPPEGFPGMPEGALDSISDVPAGPATLRGRVVREGESTGVGGLPVVLYALPPNGVPGLRAMVTDEAGAFAFESIANDPATVYLLGARYAEIPFGMRFSFEPGELEHQIELPVADATPDASGTEVGEVQIELEEGCVNLTVRETHRLDNPGTRTIYIPEAHRDRSEPILRVTLPADATALQSGLGDDLIQDGDTLSFWGPLRPGQQKIEFRYDIPWRGDVFEMSRSFPSGAGRLVLIDRPGGPKLTRSGADAAALRPGDTIALRVERAAASDAADRISALEARIWLELDGAAITVEQQYTLAIKGDGPLFAGSGAPLLCIVLPDGAGDLRFSSDTLAKGLSRDASGALAIRGPLPAGETKISLHFLLPIERSDPLFSQRMPLDVSLLSILIADTGIVVETTRLHQRRPIRTPDRSYLHLEGFEIPAGESIDLRLRPLEARKSLPKPAVTGVVFAAAALAAGFLIAPLRRAGSKMNVPPSAASRAAEERASVLAAIHGLDEDFDIGKLSEADHREMRQTLRAEAVDLLRTERAAIAAASRPDRATDLAVDRAAKPATDGAADPAVDRAAKPATDGAADRVTRSCPGCGSEAGADARFCSQCGARLDERGAAKEASRP